MDCSPTPYKYPLKIINPLDIRQILPICEILITYMYKFYIFLRFLDLSENFGANATAFRLAFSFVLLRNTRSMDMKKAGVSV